MFLIFIVIAIITPDEFFPPALADVLSLKFEW